MMITEERKKKIGFSDPFFESAVTLLARKVDLPSSGDTKGSAGEKNFWQKI
ncbi:MAG: hypothetical protein WCO93_09045 [bacterium]